MESMTMRMGRKPAPWRVVNERSRALPCFYIPPKSSSSLNASRAHSTAVWSLHHYAHSFVPAGWPRGRGIWGTPRLELVD